MTCMSNNVVSLLALLVAMLASVSAMTDIPYDGKNIHLSSQYRLHREDFKEEQRLEEKPAAGDKYHSHVPHHHHHSPHHHHGEPYYHRHHHHSPQHSHSPVDKYHQHGEEYIRSRHHQNNAEGEETASHHHHHHHSPHHHHHHDLHSPHHHHHQSPHHHHHHSHHSESQLKMAEELFEKVSHELLESHHLPPEVKHRHYEFYNEHVEDPSHTFPITDTIRLDGPTSTADRKEEPYKYQWVNHDKLDITNHLNIFQGPDGEVQTADKLYFTAENSKTSTPTDTPKNPNGWVNAFSMFAIWSVDNLFWLIPFVAHSKYNALCFVITYQAAVLVSCFLGTDQPMSFADAHSLNIVWGALGAAFCWVMAVLFFIRHQQNETLKGLMILGTKVPEEEKNDVSKECDLEAPLLVKPVTASGTLASLVNEASPSVWLTIGMTLLGSVDDIFFVPVMVESQHVSVTQVCVASILAVVTVAFVASLISSRCRNLLTEIPLFVVLGVFASSMTGHATWDFVYSAETKSYLELLEYLSPFTH